MKYIVEIYQCFYLIDLNSNNEAKDTIILESLVILLFERRKKESLKISLIYLVLNYGKKTPKHCFLELSITNLFQEMNISSFRNHSSKKWRKKYHIQKDFKEVKKMKTSTKIDKKELCWKKKSNVHELFQREKEIRKKWRKKKKKKV